MATSQPTSGVETLPYSWYADPAVAARSHWQSDRRGGEGAVRQACDQLLRARDDYERLLSDYLAPSERAAGNSDAEDA